MCDQICLCFCNINLIPLQLVCCHASVTAKYAVSVAKSFDPLDKNFSALRLYTVILVTMMT